MTISRELADEIRAIFAVDNLPDRDKFTDDMAWLNSRSDYMIEVAPPASGHLYLGFGPTIEDHLRESLSSDARRAISDKGWTFAEAWTSA